MGFMGDLNEAKSVPHDVVALPPRHLLGSPSPCSCRLGLNCKVSSPRSSSSTITQKAEPVQQEPSLLLDSLEGELPSQVSY